MKQPSNKEPSNHRVSTRLPTTKSTPKPDPRKHPESGYDEPKPTEKNIHKGPNPRKN